MAGYCLLNALLWYPQGQCPEGIARLQESRTRFSGVLWPDSRWSIVLSGKSAILKTAKRELPDPEALF